MVVVQVVWWYYGDGAMVVVMGVGMGMGMAIQRIQQHIDHLATRQMTSIYR